MAWWTLPAFRQSQYVEKGSRATCTVLAVILRMFVGPYDFRVARYLPTFSVCTVTPIRTGCLLAYCDTDEVFNVETMSWNLQENGEESFEKLQELFGELFEGDIDTFGSSSQTTTCSSSSSSYASSCGSSTSNKKRSSAEMNFGKTTSEDTSGFNVNFQSFCFGVRSFSLF